MPANEHHEPTMKPCKCKLCGTACSTIKAGKRHVQEAHGISKHQKRYLT